MGYSEVDVRVNIIPKARRGRWLLVVTDVVFWTHSTQCNFINGTESCEHDGFP